MIRANMNRKFIPLIALAAAICSCSSDSSDFGFSVYAEPNQIHAPATVSFSVIRDDGKSVDSCEGQWDFKDGVKLQGATEVTHEYTKPGKYKVSATLACEDGKSSDQIEIEVFDTVDLAVYSLDARPLDVSTDGNVNISFQVSNESETALQVSTYIDVYLTTSSELSGYREAGASRIYRYTLASLPASGSDGAVQKLEFEIPMSSSIRTGTYYLSVVVNPEHNVGELSEDNNVVVSNQALTVRNQLTDGADFVPVGFQVSPEKTSVLSSASAQLVVLNQGSTTAEDFQYEIWMGTKNNGTDMTGAVKLHEGTINGGISGVEQQLKDIMFSVTPAVSEEGLYYFWVKLDSTDKIVERDEDNNILRSEGPVQVAEASMLDADIMVNSVEFKPSSSSPGGAFTTMMSLYNQGSQPTGAFICTVFLSDDMALDVDKDHVIGAANISNLLPQATRDISLVVETDTGVSQGKYWVFVFCDSSGVVTEANEDNNIHRAEEQITITGNSNVDLVFGPVTPGDNVAGRDGDNLNVSAVICNKGTTAAGPFQISVVARNICDETERELSRISMDGLEADGCESLFIQDPISCDFWCPSYNIIVNADVTRVITEKTENNNSAELPEIITLQGDNCICASDKYEPNNTVDNIKHVKKVSDDLNLCVKDVDLFELDLAEGESFEAHLNHDSSVSQLTMELLKGTQVVNVRNTGDDLFLSGMIMTDVESEPVSIRIKGENAKSANRYHLDIDTYSRSNGIDLGVSNVILSEGKLSTSIPSEVTSLLVNNGSENVSGFYVEYYISQTPVFDESAYRISRQQVSGLAAGSTKSQTAYLVMPEDVGGGTWYLIVRIDPAEMNDIRLSNNIARSSGWFFDRVCWDSLDPNDTFEMPRKLAFSGKFTQTDLKVCQDNPDFYAFDLEDGSALDISVTGLTSGDFDLYLYDAYGNVIDSARTTSVTEKIHRNVVVGDQTVILEVRLLDNIYNATEISYEMTINVSDAPAYLLCNSIFEPNDFMSSAYPLRDAAFSGQTTAICPSDDEDYYSIPLVEGQRLQIGFDTQSSILRAALYSSDHSFLGMLTNLVTQTFDYMATQDDTYYLRIFSNASDPKSLDYTIRWLGSVDNDISVNSLDLSSAKLYAGQSLIVSFILDNQGTSPVEAAYRMVLENTYGQTVLSTGNRSLAAGKHETIMEKVTIPSNISGSARVVVNVQADGDSVPDNNTASKSITILPACTNDTNEPNNNILQATDLSGSLNGVICPGDEDWYKVTMDVSSVVTLSFTHANGDLRLTAYRDDGSWLSESDTASDIETLTLDAGTWYLRVMGATSEVTNSFRIEVNGE